MSIETRTKARDKLEELLKTFGSLALVAFKYNLTIPDLVSIRSRLGTELSCAKILGEPIDRADPVLLKPAPTAAQVQKAQREEGAKVRAEQIARDNEKEKPAPTPEIVMDENDEERDVMPRQEIPQRAAQSVMPPRDLFADATRQDDEEPNAAATSASEDTQDPIDYKTHTHNVCQALSREYGTEVEMARAVGVDAAVIRRARFGGTSLETLRLMIAAIKDDARREQLLSVQAVLDSRLSPDSAALEAFQQALDHFGSMRRVAEAVRMPTVTMKSIRDGKAGEQATKRFLDRWSAVDKTKKPTSNSYVSSGAVASEGRCMQLTISEDEANELFVKLRDEDEPAMKDIAIRVASWLLGR